LFRSPQFRVIDTAMATPDPEVAAIVAKFEDELNKGLDAPIGTTAVELDSRAATVRTRESAVGNLVADAMRWSAQTEVAVTNGGAIRGGRTYPPGATLTRRDVLSELPFGNRLVTIDISGSALAAAIENGPSVPPHPSGPVSAGLRAHDGGGGEPAAGPAHPLDQGRRRAARSEQVLLGRDQRFPGARRRRLHHLPRRHAGAADRRLAAPRLRGDRLHQIRRNHPHRRRRAHRAEVRRGTLRKFVPREGSLLGVTPNQTTASAFRPTGHPT